MMEKGPRVKLVDPDRSRVTTSGMIALQVLKAMGDESQLVNLETWMMTLNLWIQDVKGDWTDDQANEIIRTWWNIVMTGCEALRKEGIRGFTSAEMILGLSTILGAELQQLRLKCIALTEMEVAKKMGEQNEVRKTDE